MPIPFRRTAGNTPQAPAPRRAPGNPPDTTASREPHHPTREGTPDRTAASRDDTTLEATPSKASNGQSQTDRFELRFVRIHTCSEGNALGVALNDGLSVFLSYRRDDARGHAHRLYDHLVAEMQVVEEQEGFGTHQMFIDVDTLEPGVDFRDAIASAVGQCDAFLAVIGRRWLDAQAADGKRRLENPSDYVRLEIEAALDRHIPVVPILVDGAAMPGEEDLPPSLSGLAYRNAVELDDTRWRHDVGRLVEWLKSIERNKVQQARETEEESARPAETTYRRNQQRREQRQNRSSDTPDRNRSQEDRPASATLESVRRVLNPPVDPARDVRITLYAIAAIAVAAGGGLLIYWILKATEIT
jgi:TIR domain